MATFREIAYIPAREGDVKRKHNPSKIKYKGEEPSRIPIPINRQGRKVTVQNKLVRITVPALL